MLNNPSMVVVIAVRVVVLDITGAATVVSWSTGWTPLPQVQGLDRSIHCTLKHCLSDAASEPWTLIQTKTSETQHELTLYRNFQIRSLILVESFMKCPGISAPGCWVAIALQCLTNAWVLYCCTALARAWPVREDSTWFNDMSKDWKSLW